MFPKRKYTLLYSSAMTSAWPVLFPTTRSSDGTGRRVVANLPGQTLQTREASGGNFYYISSPKLCFQCSLKTVEYIRLRRSKYESEEDYQTYIHKNSIIESVQYRDRMADWSRRSATAVWCDWWYICDDLLTLFSDSRSLVSTAINIVSICPRKLSQSSTMQSLKMVKCM